ncbi:hypothetical protein VE26_00135, partial [Devosia chinhatensis]
YKPIQPDLLYDLDVPPAALAGASLIQLSPFLSPQTRNGDDMRGHIAPSFAAERAASDGNLFEAVVNRLLAERREWRRASIACWSAGTRDRMAQVPKAPGLTNPPLAANWRDAATTNSGTAALVGSRLATWCETTDTPLRSAR